jgi:hypothetical protein
VHDDDVRRLDQEGLTVDDPLSGALDDVVDEGALVVAKLF